VWHPGNASGFVDLITHYSNTFDEVARLRERVGLGGARACGATSGNRE